MRIRSILAATLTLSLVGPGLAAQNYRDVPREHWAFEEVHWIREREIIPEVSASEFQGSRTMNRYEMAETLTNYMKNYYKKRDQIDSEIQQLHGVNKDHQFELASLEHRSETIGERLQNFVEFSQMEAVPTSEPRVAPPPSQTRRTAPPPPAPAPMPIAPPPMSQPTSSPSLAPVTPPPTAGLSFRERLERLRAKVKTSGSVPVGPRPPADPTGVPPPVVTPQAAQQIWDSF